MLQVKLRSDVVRWDSNIIQVRDATVSEKHSGLGWTTIEVGKEVTWNNDPTMVVEMVEWHGDELSLVKWLCELEDAESVGVSG